MPCLEWLDPGTEERGRYIGISSQKTHPELHFPWGNSHGPLDGLRWLWKVSVGDALLGFGIPEFWEERWSQNDPDAAFLRCFQPKLLELVDFPWIFNFLRFYGIMHLWMPWVYSTPLPAGRKKNHKWLPGHCWVRSRNFAFSVWNLAVFSQKSLSFFFFFSWRCWD